MKFRYENEISNFINPTQDEGGNLAEHEVRYTTHFFVKLSKWVEDFGKILLHDEKN